MLARTVPHRRSVGVALATVVAIFGIAGAVLTVSYWSTLSYTTHHTGPSRPYDKVDVHISLTSQQSAPGASNWHRITLYRAESCWFCGDDLIGSVDVPRQGASGVRTWSNVGAANYFFKFTKLDDGVRITSDDVHMWSTW